MADFFKKAKHQLVLSWYELSRRKLSILFYTLAVIYCELIVQLNVFGKLTWKFMFTALFAVPAGVFFTLLTNLFSKKINKIVSFSLLGFLYLYYCTQIVYTYVFKTLLPASLVKMGGAAVANFSREVIDGILKSLPYELLLTVPLIAFGFLAGRLNILSVKKTTRRFKLTSAIAYVLVHFITLSSLFFFGNGPTSPYAVYFGDDANTDISARNLGLLTTSRLEFKNMLFGFGGDNLVIKDVDIDKFLEPQTPPAETTDTSPNIIDEIDFNALNAYTDNKNIQTLNNYFAGKSGTNKNEYTGYFKDKNLIVLCAESFSPYVIDKELTPTLYKMYNGGFIFNNYYNMWPNTTTNGEYTLCMGMFPDMSRRKQDGSFKFSSDNYLPFCLGNAFEDIGVNTYAYHNYRGSYYSRETSHPNMGYSTFKTMGDGMTFTTEWPSSDLEMMQQSVDDFINEDRFHAYYMTFSGHYRYDFDANLMCARNRDKVKDLDYSETVQAYISCHLELEYALSYLFDRLTEAGKLDDTVIVLASDHFPYGLTEKQYNELAGEEIDSSFGKYKSSFICYNSAMDPVEIDEPCCNIDILPTLLNLFGIEYDSRMVIGTDILSTGTHIAILSNKSFITKQMMYDAVTGEITYLVDKSKIADGYVDALLNEITNRMSVSTAILNNDYYRFVYDNAFGADNPPSNSQ